MEHSSISDFLEADLRITHLERIWHASTHRWERNEPQPRAFDGLLFFVRGRIFYDFGTFQFTAGPGQVLRLPAGIPYCGRKIGSEPNEFYVIDFLTERSGDFLRFPLPHVFSPRDPDAVLFSFRELERRWNAHGQGYRLDCRAELYRLLSSLLREHAVQDHQYGEENRILRMQHFMRERLEDPELNTEAIAKEFHISATHLRRLFAKEMRTSPGAYLTALRLEKAKQLLISHPELSVGQIAETCGYASIYYFSQSFRRAVGKSPVEYRKTARQ